MSDLFEESNAVLSDCGKHRFWLERQWGKASPQVFIMLNPSTADAEVNDPTITRCINFAKREGAGGLIVVNLFSWRATDPKELDTLDLTVENESGAEAGQNTRFIGEALLCARVRERPVICAWGSNKHASKMSNRIIDRANQFCAELTCFHINKDGQPKHPLYVGSKTPLRSFPQAGGRDE